MESSERIKNLITDLHWKTIHFLCTNFDNIIIPPFEVKNMISVTTSVLGKPTKRKLVSLCHGLFKQRLQPFLK